MQHSFRVLLLAGALVVVSVVGVALWPRPNDPVAPGVEAPNEPERDIGSPRPNDPLELVSLPRRAEIVDTPGPEQRFWRPSTAPTSASTQIGRPRPLEEARELAKKTLLASAPESEDARTKSLAELPTVESLLVLADVELGPGDLQVITDMRDAALPELELLARNVVDQLQLAKAEEWERGDIFVATDPKARMERVRDAGPMSTYSSTRIGGFSFQMHVNSFDHPNLLLASQTLESARARIIRELRDAIAALR